MDDKTGQEAGPSENTMLPSEGPRESLIQTAVKFLQNPKVRESDFSQRRTFLEKKGLTKEEIDIAIERSGTAADQDRAPVAAASPAPAPSQYGVAVQPPVTVIPPVSMWARIRDYIATAIVLGGVSYTVYLLYKKYIKPYLYGPSKEEKQLDMIQKSMAVLQQNIAEMLKSMQEMQATVARQQGNFQENAVANGKIRDGQYVNEIKEEIKSLKGLLLSRKQFPSAPTTNPVIPSWQLSAKPTSETPGVAVAASKGDSVSDVSEDEQKSQSTTSKVTFSMQDTDTEVVDMPLGLESAPVSMATHSEPDPVTTETSNIPGPVTMTTADVPEVDKDVTMPSQSAQPQVNGEVHMAEETPSDLQFAGQGQEVKDSDCEGVKAEKTDSSEEMQPEFVQQDQ